MTAEFRDKAAARPQGAANARYHIIRTLHPVEGSVTEDSVELFIEGELMAVHNPYVQATPAGRFDLLDTAVDSQNVTAHCSQFFGQGAIAATQIQKAFAGFWREQFHDRTGEVRDETRAS